MSNLVNFDEVNSRVLGNLESLLREWLPAGQKINNEYVCGDWNGTKGESLSINLRTGVGGDFSSGEMAKDPIDIYCRIFRCDRITAARELAGIFGLEGGEKNKRQAKYTEKQPTAPEEDQTDEEKQLKINQLLAESIPIKGTPAQLYLKSRGIKGCNPSIFKFRPNKKGSGGSLLCIAYNDAGEVKAIQSVYLTAEGQKAKLKVVKRTNGFPSGHPVKIPGKQDCPILVTEGPEDALTLRQATGFEVWCACGINFIDKIPMPADGRQIIIVRDNDPDGSDADNRMTKCITNLLDRGFQNLLCARAPEGIKDANQLLQEQGEEDVVKMINAAKIVTDARYITPPPPPTNYEEPPVSEYENPEYQIFQRCSEQPYTDTGNAARISIRWGHIVKYAPGIGWLVYNKGRWDPELADLRVIKMAKVTAIDIADEMDYVYEHKKNALKSWATKSQSGPSIKYALHLAQPELAIKPKLLDDKHLYLNVANGVVDLKTGKLLPHNPDFYLTKQSNVAYDPAAKCPTWEKFLKSIFPGNEDIIPFIRRAVGYSLTGDTREQCMFILHGAGSNGKSTFIDALQSIMNDYWVKTKAETFMEKDRPGSDANPFLAMLRGARLVTVSETKQGSQLDESLVKEVTGDSFVTVRNLHQNPITFMPTFKLWMSTNNKPEIRGTDDGIWRRLKLIPFKAKFWDPEDPDAPENGPFKDKMLLAKLKAELPGILTWAVRGCIEWQKGGLQPPQVVLEATNEYRSDMDVIGSFLEERTEKVPLNIISCNVVYESYRDWSEKNGHGKLSKNKFGRMLYERGIEKSRTAAGEKAYLGIKLKPVQQTFNEYFRR